MSRITEIIKSEIDVWRSISYMELNSARDINKEFSEEFSERIVENNKNLKNIEIKTYRGEEFVHTILHYNNKYYDAECPEGVNNIKDIPRIKRNKSDINQKIRV